MAHKSISCLTCALAALTASSVALAGVSTPCNLETFINESTLIALAQAKDVKILGQVWSGLPYKDLVQRVVYCTRLQQLEPSTETELELLRTIPSSPLEFSYVYAINNTKAWNDCPDVPKLYASYFPSLAAAAAKHPEFIKQFLMLNRFADGESKNDTDEATKTLKRLNPSGYLEGLRRLDSESQEYVCGDCPELKEGPTNRKR